jgi:GNAT superfamily N-acetyltransferase
MVREAASLHLDAFAGYLNCSLGRKYIRAFIRWFTGGNNTIAIAALDRDQKVVGYAIGAPVSYDRVLNRELFWVVFAAVVLHPRIFFRRSFWQVVKVRLLTLLRHEAQPISCCKLPEPRMSLVAIGVARSWRSKGVGLMLMQDFVSKAKELKMRSLTLSVHEDEMTARAFYEKCGWRPCAAATGPRVSMKYCRSIRCED